MALDPEFSQLIDGNDTKAQAKIAHEYSAPDDQSRHIVP